MKYMLSCIISIHLYTHILAVAGLFTKMLDHAYSYAVSCAEDSLEGFIVSVDWLEPFFSSHAVLYGGLIGD